MSAPVLRASWTFDASYPAFEGHFPGQPLLPGVVLLAHVLELWQAQPGQAAGSAAVVSVSAAKFLAPVYPGTGIEVSLRPDARGASFDIHRSDGVLAASGRLVMGAA